MGAATRPRLLIVSNRLPVTVKLAGQELHVERSPGGLATGLKGPHEASGGEWVGWSGITDEDLGGQGPALAERLAALRLVGVPLSHDEVSRYYEAVCNGVLWPLFHYFVGQLPLEVTGFDVYEQVNRRFAEAVVARYQPGDTIWIHDYQLMRVPALVRERLPNARIGFFLHIPFPTGEVFRTLPFRELLLEGLLGADLIGFHTAAYMRNFSNAALLVLGAATDVGRIRWNGRPVRVGVFPMGIDAHHFSATAAEPSLLKEVEDLRGSGELQLLVGIDRLDYTKGIPRRLLAFERMLREHPELHGRVRLIQVAVPSRTNVEAYQEFRETTDALIGRINGAFGTARWTPVHYLYRALSERDVVVLYRAADVMLVTPIRDGMNLVSKEFVASRNDEDGVLVLSEFAGAATELGEALHVNPYDVQRTAELIHRALVMTPDERRARMHTLRKRVLTYDVNDWAERFIAQLETPQEREQVSWSASPRSAIAEAVESLRAARERVLLLDYDGTLVGFASLPELAVPDAALLELLKAVATRPGTVVHLVSGRMRETLERWFGALPVGLHAEHGFWSRSPGATEWISVAPVQDSWRDAVLQIFADYAARTPGALVEEKRAGVAWHHRMADPEYGAFQANELKVHLTATLSNAPVEILAGDHVIEVRPHGVSKGAVVSAMVAAHPNALIAAMGDDRTDEDMFAALPPRGMAIHVGPKPSRAPLRLATVDDARAFLRALL